MLVRGVMAWRGCIQLNPWVFLLPQSPLHLEQHQWPFKYWPPFRHNTPPQIIPGWCLYCIQGQSRYIYPRNIGHLQMHCLHICPGHCDGPGSRKSFYSLYLSAGILGHWIWWFYASYTSTAHPSNTPVGFFRCHSTWNQIYQKRCYLKAGGNPC